MLPPFRQRILVALSVLVGGACLWPIGAGRAEIDAGPWLASVEGLAMLGLALPAIALGLVASSAGHPAAGVFVLALSLLMPAMVGGPIDPWLLRIESPGALGGLAVEALLYAALMGGYALAIRRLRPKLRSLLPAALRSEHLGRSDPWRLAASSFGVTLAVAVGGGGVLTWLLLQSSYTGQVTGGLLAAFLLAGLAAHSFAPRPSLLATVVAPPLVGVVGYALVAVQFGSAEDLLRSWYTGGLHGLVLARPIDYASAGVAGGVMGAGLAQALAHARAEHSREAA